MNAMECCKTEGTVDVFQVVRALRIQKPGAVPTVVSQLWHVVHTVSCIVHCIQRGLDTKLVIVKPQVQGMYRNTRVQDAISYRTRGRSLRFLIAFCTVDFLVQPEGTVVCSPDY